MSRSHRSIPTTAKTLAVAMALLTATAQAQTPSAASSATVESRAANAQPPDTQAADAALDTLLDEQWQGFLRDYPEQASFFGDYRYNSRWSDMSLSNAAKDEAKLQRLLKRFQAIDPHRLSDNGRLNRQLMMYWLQSDLKAYALKTHEMPLDQFNGVHLLLPILASAFPFNTTQQYDEYLVRLRAIPKLMDQVAGRARQGVKDGLVPPRYLLEKLVAQCNDLAAAAGADNVFAASLKKFPDAVPAADRERLTREIVTAVDNDVRPAYRKLARFIAEEYAPKGREQPGAWSLPNGDALYRYWIQLYASTTQSPEQIHALGLSEVARIEKAQAKIARDLGYADLKTMRERLRTDPKQHAHSREQILDLYRQYIAQMEPRLPELFGRLPAAKVVVKPVEAYNEKTASAASYMVGTTDGSRPGVIMVNTGQPEQRLLTMIESIAYHEGVPGHHLQLSISSSLTGLPPFRTKIVQTAYAEGWGLYAERLGKELGFYKDPYSDFGHLSQELARANRLVLDTGVHYKRWTRDQMVAWLREHSDTEEPNLQAEVDRYIAWPGQALAYKLGELKILELRERAQKALGSRFDIRAFHDEVLGGGYMPLAVLEERIDAWIARHQAGHGGNDTTPQADKAALDNTDAGQSLAGNASTASRP